MKQQERQERSRREIFQAAMEEFGAHGYDKVSMENLCTRHGISKGMMYHYYSNKDELFLLCVQDVFQKPEGADRAGDRPARTAEPPCGDPGILSAPGTLFSAEPGARTDL